MLNRQVDKSNSGLSTRNLLLGMFALGGTALIITELFIHLVANMYGPLFLLFYGVVIAIILATTWQLVQQKSIQNQPLPIVSAEPNPYKIAYLNSAAKGVAEVAVINLIQKDYLQIQDKKIIVNANHPARSQLNPIELTAFVYFSAYSKSIVSIESLAENVKPHASIYEQQLLDEQLLTSEKQTNKQNLFFVLGAVVIIGLGIFKLVAALAKGHYNVGFLILMAVFGLIFLWYICQNSRLTSRGKTYLQQLQQIFSQLQQKIKTEPLTNLEYNLAVALFGFNVLAGTAYAACQQIFYPVTTTTRTYRNTSSSSSRSGGCGSSCSSISSCSSSCSSSDSGGSSCGSSCGGCGGCGGGCGG
ncbi:MAG TPA: TIGR04222 domain-containing membrane protein [Nostocaceae cyanobacterium]|nr:TIGR04222 domain-containing membrane protein [Nostocaceae cyanobacterium]